MWVCYCELINEEALEGLVREGLNTLEAIEGSCYAGTGCGCCIPQILEIIDRVSKEDVQLQRIKNILSKVKYKDWKLIAERLTPEDRVFVFWSYTVKCVRTNKLLNLTSRKHYLEEDHDEYDLINLAFALALEAEEHESKEHFFYQNIAPYNPHVSLDILLRTLSEEKEQ